MSILKTLGLSSVPQIDRNLNLLTLGFIGIAVFCSIYFYAMLPEEIPTHFDIEGNVNRYGNKSSILLLCGITAIMGLGLLILSNFPQTFNYHIPITESNKESQYKLASLMIRQLNAFVSFSLAMLVLYICLLASEKFSNSSFPILFTIVLLVGIVAIIANYMVKSNKLK
jgi:uncharacterized membrane protein